MANRSNEGFRPLGRVLDAEARRLKLDGSLREASAVTLWSLVVGEQIAAATEAERVRDGVLYVIARNNTWAFELNFHREQIRKGLNARLGKETVREIRVRPGVIHSPGAPPPPPEPVPTAAELEAMPVAAADAATIEREVGQLTDPEMQTVVRRLLVNERKRVAWQRRQGMRECGGCGAMYSSPGERCPGCRSEAR